MASGDSWQNEANQNRTRALTQGDQLQSQFGGQYNNYAQEYGDFGNQAYSAAQGLQETPGYNDQQASAIEGNPSSALDYYNPQQLQSTVNQTTGQLTNNVNGLQSNLNKAATTGASTLSAVPQQQLGYQSNLYDWQNNQNNANLGSYSSDLNSSVDPSKLTIGSDFANEYKMSPEEMQNIKDVAGNTVRGQYGLMDQQAETQAAQNGNTSPAAMAAIRANLGQSGAVNAGTAMAAAEQSANSEQAQREMNLEQTELGANQTVAGMQQANASNLYGARAGASQNLTNTEMGGINSYAQNAENAASQGANMGYNAASEGGEAGINATEYGGNLGTGVGEYNTTTGMGGSEYADTNASNRATTVANQAITGQNNYRNYLTGEQQLAQQGQSTAGSQQNQAYGSEYGAANNATQTGSQNQTTNRGQTTNMTSGLINDFFADGGIVDKPTVGVIGERGPEMVIPLGKESVAGQRKRYRMPMAA